MDKIRVFVVEDQPKILKNLIKLLAGFEQIEIVGKALSGEEALQAIPSAEPNVVLMDLGLPQMSGIDATRALKKIHPKIEILIFTIFDEEDRVMEAIQAGASGYLLKGMEAEKIVEAIHEVNDGGSVIQPSLARRLLRHFRVDPVTGTVDLRQAAVEEETQQAISSPGAREEAMPTLTNREIEILQIIAKGLSNAEAAQVLKISRATIRTHLEHIYAKLSVSNRVEAITEGIRQGLIDV
jgi:DNA-binding NarL/FixJ family response regulator